MRQHTDLPGSLLFGGTGTGFVALLCYQYGYVITAIVLTLLTITLHGAGALRVKRFYA